VNIVLHAAGAITAVVKAVDVDNSALEQIKLQSCLRITWRFDRLIHVLRPPFIQRIQGME